MNTVKTILKVLLVIVILIVMSLVGIVGATFYKRWEADIRDQIGSGDSPFGNLSGLIVDNKEVKEENFTCLFMGVNGTLTDFIMLGQYNPNTRDIALLSIPRDTRVDSVDGKINSLYGGKHPERTVAKVQEITGIEIQHYLVFDTKILRKLVDEIGGVTVDVPINMNYDDPDQNLYIHLKKGTQVLTGKQAEQFCRFRKNNDGTGYALGDVGRISAQQQFIKAMASEILTKHVSRIGTLVKIALDGTKTDLTMDILSKYIDDAVTIKLDRIRMETLPGVGKTGPTPSGNSSLSYFYHDEEKTKELVEELFKKETEDENVSGDNDVIETNGELITNQNDKIRLEVLNSGTSTKIVNSLVQKLNSSNFNVVKIGNYKTTVTESSRIIDYGKGTDEELEELKKALNINKVEKQEDETSIVKYTVILGQNYSN